MKNVIACVSVFILMACTHKTESRGPAQEGFGPEFKVFDNSSFGNVSPQAKESAKMIYFYRRSAEEAYRKAATDRLNEKNISRDTHGKTHACVQSQFQVNSDIPAAYRQGLFAQAGKSYPAWIRFSNGGGPRKDDLFPDARSMAMKLMSVSGEKALSGFADEETHTQDFLFNNAPTFFVGQIAEAEEFFKEDADGNISNYFIGTMNPLSPTYKKRVAFNALYITKMESNMLLASYWGGSHFKFGKGPAVRFQIRACGNLNPKNYSGFPEEINSEPLKTYKWKMDNYVSNFSPLVNGNPDFQQLSTRKYLDFLYEFPFALALGRDFETGKMSTTKTYNYLSENLVTDIEKNSRPGCFEFGVQAYENEKTTPTVQPVAIWKSKPIWIAKILIPPQKKISAVEQKAFCEQMTFNPWHGLKEHEPLGDLNALRGMVYKAFSTYRHAKNGTVTGEPLPDGQLKLVSPERAKSFYRER